MNTDTKRRRGMGRIFRRHNTWWIAFCVDGKERRESTHTDDYSKAEDLLNRRVVEMQDGRLPAPQKERKASVNRLLDDLVADWTARQKRSANQLPSNLKALRKAFGDRRAASITKADLTQYILAARKARFSDGTIGKQLRLLKQAYHQNESVPTPTFPEMPQGKIRDVLIQPAEAARLIKAFTNPIHRDIAETYFATGWRGREIRTLRWENVREGSIHLIEEFSKTGEPRDFPITGELLIILKRREQARLPFSPYVFHRKGKPIGYRAYLKAWKRAAAKAGLGPVNPHDARRAFVTTAVNSGIDPQTARTLSGHKSNAIFERYRIVSDDVLKEAAEQREQYVAKKIAAAAGKVRVLPTRLSENPVRDDLGQLRKANGE